MVAPGGGHLQGPAGAMLSGDVGEVGDVRALVRIGPGAGDAGAEAGAREHESGQHGVRAARWVGRFLLGDLCVGEDGDQLAQAAYAEHADVGDEHGLGGALLRHHHVAVSGVGSCEDGGQDAPYRPHPAVQPQLSDEHEVGDGGGVDHLGGAQYGGRDGQVESGARFRDGGRAESDGEFLLRPCGARVHDGGPDPVPTFDQGLVGQAHQGEGGNPGLQVGLDLDHHSVDADQGHRAGSCEAHHATPRTCSTTGAPRRGRRTPTRSMRTPPGGGPP